MLNFPESTGVAEKNAEMLFLLYTFSQPIWVGG